MLRGTVDSLWLITQVPQTGYVSFTLVPAGTPIGQGGVVPDNTLGLASVTIVKSPGNSGVYGIPPPGAYTGEPSSDLLDNAGNHIALLISLKDRVPPLHRRRPCPQNHVKYEDVTPQYC